MRGALFAATVCGFAALAAADEAVLQDGIVLFDAGERRDAVPLLQAVANDGGETAAHRAKAFLYLGLCQVALGDTDAAAGYMRQAYQLDGTLTLPGAAPPGAVALANEARAGLGLPALADQSPPPEPMAPPPPLPPAATDQARLGAARAELDRMSAMLRALQAQGATQSEVDRVGASIQALKAQTDELDAASGSTPPPAASASAAAPPPAPPKDMGPFILGADVVDVAFFGGSKVQVSPTPEIELGAGTDAVRLSAVLGLMLGQEIGYSEKLRWAMLGTSAQPVGWNWTIDVGLVEVTGPQATTYFDISSSPINITWKVAKRLLVEGRFIGVGYYLSLDGNAMSTWSLESGLAVRWLP
ncbi:MAG: tetratricopeptide repeat protein [Myxococcales bacterium]